MTFKKAFFDPPKPKPGEFAGKIEDNPDDAEPVYNYSESILLAVNVAMAAERPLLVAGPPGSGKTTLARNIARVKGWRYLYKTVTSRTRAEDLLAQFDTLRRLSHAQMGERHLLRKEAYVEPGVLWWAFNPDDARWRGAPEDELTADEKKLIEITDLPGEPGKGRETDSVVVLLDEIDKADPDVPNDLLEPLDRGTFEVRDTRHTVARGGHTIFLMLTTNGERELPPAFVRRCVVLRLAKVTQPWLVEVATRHHGPEHADLYEALAGKVIALRDAAVDKGLREPSTAEFLNAVRACHRLGFLPDTELWKRVDEVLTHAVVKPLEDREESA